MASVRAWLLALLAVSACARRPGGGVDAAVAAEPEPMLAAVRLDVLRPAAIVARLALPPDAIVADVGAGPGAFTQPLARAVPRGRVIATDIDARALARLEADAARAGLINIEARVVAADAPGLGDRQIDLAFLCQVDHYLRDRRAYLRALARSLRPGGRVVIVNYLREQRAVDALAAELGWREVDRWQPAEGYFARTFVV